MTPKERFFLRLEGKPVDRPPNCTIVMGFGARRIGRRISEFLLDYQVLTQAAFSTVRDFDIDVVSVISDPYREAYDLCAACDLCGNHGLPDQSGRCETIEFVDDGQPIMHGRLLEDPRDFSRLEVVAPEEGSRMRDRLMAVRRFRMLAGTDYPVMGWIEGAFAEACDLFGLGDFMQLMMDDPESAHALLEFACQQEESFAIAQVDSGADVIGLGDAAASLIGPEAYAEFALPYEKRLFQAVRRAGAVGRLHICGDTNAILPLMAESGASVVDIDWPVDYAVAVGKIGSLVSVCGNVDPVRVMLQGSASDVAAAVGACLAGGNERSMIMPGCEIPIGTPPGNLTAFADALWNRAEGSVSPHDRTATYGNVRDKRLE
jgi:MtaA/CmuA family methyltransferase